MPNGVLRVVLGEAVPGARTLLLAVEAPHVDGFFCVTDSLAMGVLRGLADAGIRVPDQVKVIGFDNVTEGEFFIPSLSTVDRTTTAWPSAVDLLTRLIEQTEPAVRHEESVGGFSVVIRESTGG
ncbi:substrate-binding domain-containing protein [Streptomyces sp. ME19-01-6]|uniref:substrate-binding domain-containing protein n=1 Tax=Streptomyces sp. ME19-01-6 TaxID=3028686 RepID=UPI0029B00B56|nr:substrate-binding domain-containing protein [Streptomyces sp. ME19-01-6]MDX3225839.1 substrate-binding domain-containing protein [Streptomyces sp. ME19-01-6]